MVRPRHGASRSALVFGTKHSTFRPRPLVATTEPLRTQAVSPAPRTPPRNSDTADRASEPSISTTTSSIRPSGSSLATTSVSLANAWTAGPLQKAIWKRTPRVIARTTRSSASGTYLIRSTGSFEYLARLRRSSGLPFISPPTSVPDHPRFAPAASSTLTTSPVTPALAGGSLVTGGRRTVEPPYIPAVAFPSAPASTSRRAISARFIGTRWRYVST